MNPTITSRRLYEAELLRLHDAHAAATGNQRTTIAADIAQLKRRRFAHLEALANIPDTPTRKTRRTVPEPRFSTTFDRERHEERAERELMQAMSNPFKTNDRKDDMRYQTAGVPNRRGKRRR